MKQSELFSKTRKEAPKDEAAKNAKLLIRGGFVHKEMAGVYTFMPLGRLVFERIVDIIRQEMNSLGGQEVTLTALQEATPWQKTGRWDDEVLDVWFKTELKNGGVLGLATTHEEPLTAIARDYINSYRDLPKYVYQFQTKFRNETRAKSGLMRCREFVMKDLYSFCANQESHEAFYQEVMDSYARIFKRVGLGDSTFVTFASGGSFSKYSHEFQTVTDAGEDTIYVRKDKSMAINKEVFTDEVLADLGAQKDDFEPHTAVEVGNIFTLGTRFSEPLELMFKDKDGALKPVFMGSYGIGPGRLMGTVVELFSDENAIYWPASIAPADVHLLLVSNDDAVKAAADKLYADLTGAGMRVLYDDRDARAGEKFADADLIGIPLRVTLGDKSFKAGEIEVLVRQKGGANTPRNIALSDSLDHILKHHEEILSR